MMPSKCIHSNPISLSLLFFSYIYDTDLISSILGEVWEVMQDAVRRGLEAEGILPGGLGIRRKASDYMIRAKGYGSSIKITASNSPSPLPLPIIP